MTAAYQRERMHIALRAVVTAEHPAISEEEVQDMHWGGITYDQADVEQMSQERYEAKNGVSATVVSVTSQAGTGSTTCEAAFAANGASYRIRVTGYGPQQAEAAKTMLIGILEEFEF